MLFIYSCFTLLISLASNDRSHAFSQQDPLSTTHINNYKMNCTNLIMESSTYFRDGSSRDYLYDNCKGIVKIMELIVVCRHESYVQLEWKVVNEENIQNISFLIQQMNTNKSTLKKDHWHNNGWTLKNEYTAEGLSKNTRYNFKVTPYFGEFQIGLPVTSSSVTTFGGDETLESMTGVNVGNFTEYNELLQTSLTWNASKDLSCQTNLIIYKEGTLEHYMYKINSGYTYLLNSLSYSSTYVVTLFTSVGRSESTHLTYSFKTPSCLAFNAYNLTKCAPDAPEHLTVENSCTTLNLSWNEPQAYPDFYKLIIYYDTGELRNFTILGEKTSFTVKERMSPNGHHYMIHMTAVSSAGESGPVYVTGVLTCVNRSSNLIPNKKEINHLMNLKMEGNCHPDIMWDAPSVYPDFYNISIRTNISSVIFTIPGNETRFKVEHIKDGRVEIDLAAYIDGNEIYSNQIMSKVNCSDSKIQRKDSYGNIFTVDTSNMSPLLITAIAISVILLFILCRITFWVTTKQKDVDLLPIPEESYIIKEVSSKKADNKNNNTDKPDEATIKENVEINKIKYDEYEIKRDTVELCQFLGEGEFGVVYKASIKIGNDSMDVAVKTLRNKACPEEKRQLETEMEVMKSVGKHRNIVSLVGCCSEEMILVVEYCSLGDLRGYLRKARLMKTWAEETISNRTNMELFERKAFSNMLYEQSDAEKSCLNLSILDLLSFARQIALGMVYLSENRVVHRDLAARNVLLAEDMTAKIADFGLSRDVYERNIYTKRSTDKLPIRWMAIESLLYQVFSTKSDVWSFGILLWEIVTLGGWPYPSIHTPEIYKLLQEGYRMERPRPCNPQLYEIMLKCWDAKHQNRPSFSQIVHEVEVIMKDESNRSYLDLSVFD